MRRSLLLLFIVALGVPFGSWLAWYWTPPHNVQLLILDKTVVSASAEEHRSLSWLLIHERYVPRDGTYESEENYVGLYPMSDSTYIIRGFELMTDRQLDSAADANDMAYAADTYGTFEADWREAHAGLAPSQTPQRMLYGGLHDNDLHVLRRMADQEKLVIAEFNFFGPPTHVSVRRHAEQFLGVTWTGWIGRFFISLDSAGTDLPPWVMKTYKEQHNGTWPFGPRAGIVFIRFDESIAILEEGPHLRFPAPRIVMMTGEADRYGTPSMVHYPFWFDVVVPDSTMRTTAYFELSLTAAGDSVLRDNDIPAAFPAILESKPPRHVFYFAGDFADNPIGRDYLAYFRGMRSFRKFFYKRDDIGSRAEFYWEFYYPLMGQILKSGIR